METGPSAHLNHADQDARSKQFPYPSEIFLSTYLSKGQNVLKIDVIPAYTSSSGSSDQIPTTLSKIVAP